MKKGTILAGFEPAFFWSVVRRVIHCATGPQYLLLNMQGHNETNCRYKRTNKSVICTISGTKRITSRWRNLPPTGSCPKLLQSSSGENTTKLQLHQRLVELGLLTLEERRHQADICLMHKIMHGIGGLDHDVWFEKASESVRVTRVAADGLNVKVKNGRLEFRRNFLVWELQASGMQYRPTSRGWCQLTCSSGRICATSQQRPGCLLHRRYQERD